ncbi:LamG-like jellyroll fold domain-containing protein [Nonomuraea composti]|nr:LamG-like jellyroll fold domain-containing protein [Nonomuraea sp. FMUSA5-5]
MSRWLRQSMVRMVRLNRYVLVRWGALALTLVLMSTADYGAAGMVAQWQAWRHREVHGLEQVWGAAGEAGGHVVGGTRNDHRPATLRARYPLTAIRQGTPPPDNPVEVGDAPVTEPAAGAGFDPATSREIPERRDAYVRTFANADGTESTEVSARPVNYRRPDGTWAPIDTRLVGVGRRGGDGAPDGGWRNAADAVDIRLAPRADARPLVRVGLDDAHQVGYGVDDGAAVPGRATGKRAVTYEGVWPDTDLKIEAGPGGVKETIVLRSAAAPRTFVFPLSLRGLTARITAGQVEFVDEAGQVRAGVPAGFMTDAAATPAVSTAVAYSLVEAGGGPALRVSVDPAWLADPGRRFPVLVDPSVETGKAGNSVSVGDGGTTGGGQTLSIGSRSAAYVTFPSLVNELRYHRIFGAYLWMVNYEAVTCQARPVTVHPVTAAWSSRTTYPGPSVGRALVRKSFSHGYIAFGSSTSRCPPKKGELFDLGKRGRDLVQRWVDDPSANFGLSIRDASSDAKGFKKFTGHDTANPPRLYVTHSPYNASYAITSPVPDPPVTQAQPGRIKMTVTNTGAAAWAQGDYYLAYRAYDGKGKLVTQQRSANLTASVPRGGKARLDAEIKPLKPGTYKLDFTMVRAGGKVFTDEYVPPARLIIKIIDIAPVLQELYPFNGYQAPTLTPQLWARAVDLDAPPSSSLSYKFEVCEKAADGSAAGCFDSGYLPRHAWTVPAGRLSWTRTYLWRVFVKDTGNEVPSPRVMMQTSVPQPEITSKLAEARERGFDPMAGNYSTSAVDASVATVGPSLSVERVYNSLDPRRDSPFGAGWSTPFDMKLTEDGDGSGNVVVGYPDGQQVRFGRNPDGSYGSPQGRQATLTLGAGQGRLTDKAGSVFEFVNGRLTRMSDAAGHAITLTYDAATGRLAKATGPGGRALTFAWSGGHVASVSAGPVDGRTLTWAYTYDGDKLTRVCGPGERCTGYEYTPGSHYRTTVMDSRPESYWRLGEDEGDAAASQVAVNLGADAGTYRNVTLGEPGAAAGSGDTAAVFDGTAAQVVLPNGTLKKSRDLAVEVWFRNQATGPGGPLLGYQDKALDGTPGVGVPVLYTGADGRLRGQFWSGGTIAPMTSPVAVNDGRWHHAVLSAMGSAQTLYLDGKAVATLSNQTPDHLGLTFNQIGAAYATTPGSWPGWGTTPRRFYSGTIDEVALYQHPLGPEQVAAHHRAGLAAADQLAVVTLPSGKVAAEVEYDTAADRVSAYTDSQGGTWKLGTPVVYGGDDDLRRAVELRDPADRHHLYEQDAITGQIVRVGIPLGLATREEDRPDWPQSPSPAPSPTVTCTSPDPGDPRFCTTLPGSPGQEPDFIGRDADGMGIRTFDYDDRGFPTRIVDENGDAVQLAYDSRGNLTRRVSCRAKDSCQSAYYTYPAFTDPADPRNDRPVEYRDGRSSGPADDRYKTTYAYTAPGNLLTQTNPSGGGQLRYTYTNGSEAAIGGGATPAHLVATMTDPRGAVTRYAYTAAGDLAQVTEQSGLITKYTYDAIGRLKSTVEVSDSFPAGVTTGYGYDDWSNLTSVTDPATTDAVTGAQQQRRTDLGYDADGNLVRTQVVDKLAGGEPRTTTYGYDDHNRLDEVVDAYGHETAYGYDRFGNVVEMTDAGDNEYAFAYTARNMLASVTLRDFDGDPDGAPGAGDDLVLASYAYDYAGRLVRGTDAMGRRTVYDYYTDDLLKSATLKDFRDAGGTERDLVLSATEYDGAGRPTKQTTGNGLRVTENTYDAAGRLATATLDPGRLNRRTTYTYDLGGNVTRVARTGNPSNLPWPVPTAAETVDYAYDLAGRLVRETVTDGTRSLVTGYGYDQRDLLTSAVDPRGNVTGADKAAYTTTYTNDELGRPVRTVLPPVRAEEGGAPPVTVRPETVTGYNAFDEETATRDARGAVTRTEYDLLGQPVKRIAPAYTPPGGSTALTPTTVLHYDPLGRPVKVVDPRQNETLYTYDRLGRVQVVDAPAGTGDDRAQWHYDYTRTGRTLSVVDPNGARTEATYDDLDRQVTGTQIERVPEPAAHTTRYTYDDAGSPLTATTPSGAVTRNAYDGTGALTKVTDPAGVVVQYGYDGQGRQARLSDGMDRTTKLTYDPAGRLTTVADLKPDGTELRSRGFAYDPAGNLTEAVDALQHRTTFEYDALDQLVKQVEPVSGGSSITTAFGHDAAGDLTRLTDGRGNSTIYTYNSLGLPESTIEPATTAHPGAAERTFITGYDATGNPVSVTEPGGVVRRRTFDAGRRLLAETGTGAARATPDRTFGYDAAGRLTRAGSDVYGYDDRGELVSADGPSGEAAWAYDGDGRPTTRTDAAGTATFSYAKGRLTGVRDAITGVAQTLRYDASGQVDEVDYGDGRVRALGYDDLARITSDTLKNGGGQVVASTAYGYDDNDRTTSKTTTGLAGAGTSTYGYDHAGRLTSWSDGTTTTAYEWDAAGNRMRSGADAATFDQRNRRLTDGDDTYTYTARGTLATKTSSGTVTAYDFDAFNRLTSVGATTYTYDSLDRLSARGTSTFTYAGPGGEPVGDGTTTFGRGPGGELLSAGQGGAELISLLDKHGDVVGGFDPDGALSALTGSTAYDPFGTPTAGAGSRIGLGYQGDWADPGTGHVNMGARWYDPATAAFTTRDDWNLSPVPDSAEANRYTYAGASPLDHVDPTGHDPCSPGGGGGSQLASYGGGCWYGWCFDNETGMYYPCGGPKPPCVAPLSMPSGTTMAAGRCDGGGGSPGGGGGSPGGGGGARPGGGGGGGISPEEQRRRERERQRRRTEAGKKRQERHARRDPVAPPPSAGRPHYPDPRDKFPGARQPAPITQQNKNVVKDTTQSLKDMRDKAVREAGPIVGQTGLPGMSAPEISPAGGGQGPGGSGGGTAPQAGGERGEGGEPGLGAPELKMPELAAPELGCKPMQPQWMCGFSKWWEKTKQSARWLGGAIGKGIDYLGTHIGASISACALVCGTVTVQDGEIWFAWGGPGRNVTKPGVLDPFRLKNNFGLSLGGQWTSKSPGDQGPQYQQYCLYYRVGGCYMNDPDSDWWGLGVGGGFGAQAGPMRQYKIWDMWDRRWPWNY